MKNLGDIQIICICTFFILSMLLYIRWIGMVLANRNGRDIRSVCYLFSLSMVCTLVGLYFAINAGAIDADGRYQGYWGEKINWLLSVILDLSADIEIFTALLVIYVLPQAMTYILSGLFGRASRLIFIGGAFRIYFLSIVKSFIIASGVVFAIAAYSHFYDWRGLGWKKEASMFISSFVIISIVFFYLSMYREIFNSSLKIQKFSYLNRLHSWFTRKSI